MRHCTLVNNDYDVWIKCVFACISLCILMMLWYVLVMCMPCYVLSDVCNRDVCMYFMCVVYLWLLNVSFVWV